jgi:iron complex transport system substrate-binding protein
MYTKPSLRRNTDSVIYTATVCILIALFTCSRTPQKTGKRIVSLSPAMTEILFSLGAQDNLVGVTTFCDYPEEAKRIHKVGDFSHPSIERIVGLKPDIVIVNVPEQLRIKEALEKLGINVFVSSPQSLSDIYTEIAALAELIDRDAVADSLIHYMKANMKQSECKSRKRVYVELAPRPIVTIGASNFLNELLELTGATNIFSDIERDYPIVSQEVIIARNPEVIIVLHPGDISNRIGWQKITAIKNGSVIKNLNQDHLLRPGPRLVDGFHELQKVLSE